MRTPQGDSNRLGSLSTRRPGTAITRPTEDHLSQRLHDQRPGTAITRPIGNRLLALGSSAAKLESDHLEWKSTYKYNLSDLHLEFKLRNSFTVCERSGIYGRTSKPSGDCNRVRQWDW